MCTCNAEDSAIYQYSFKVANYILTVSQFPEYFFHRMINEINFINYSFKYQKLPKMKLIIG